MLDAAVLKALFAACGKAFADRRDAAILRVSTGTSMRFSGRVRLVCDGEEGAWAQGWDTQVYENVDQSGTGWDATDVYEPDQDAPADVRHGVVATYRSWPKWARIAAPLAAVIITLGAIGAASEEPEDNGRQVAAQEATSTTTTTDRTSTTERHVAATAAPTTTATTAPPTTSAPTTAPPTTKARPVTTAAPPPPPTTAAPPPPPPTTQPPSGGTGVTPGAFCSPAGAPGTSVDGVPMSCSTQKCDGTPYEQPRWRRTNC